MIAEKDTILKLKLPTDPRWVAMADDNLEEILVDHAYCEQKAASSCISLIVQFSDRPKLVDVLSPIVAEEWEHFQRVLEQIRKRGFTLGRTRTDEYVVKLAKHERKGGPTERQLMDKLLINAMIEARSCERFKILWKNLADEELKAFYYDLMASEAGHYVTFIKLAKEYMPEEVVKARWTEFLEIEANIIQNLEIRSDRMH
ncbi:tRNA-(ms[2]io[6]A)-hydroxylase [Tunicatimonas pelagia]|uniref:tRNA-(ms[2]io[6]A)-hydroxylase n=1 Tax=Tunicatimonas pelagia TaxID=931531 RepID=UPI0026665949|nr:tRNA-(ms[2]io[6]A)-hydroxylase [Tunicatimonas pelagia]WKN44764.1 tRNA-(ms[2]io[6]A)-hydroxylase [Tunicatimonas pelagia]